MLYKNVEPFYLNVFDSYIIIEYRELILKHCYFGLPTDISYTAEGRPVTHAICLKTHYVDINLTLK